MTEPQWSASGQTRQSRVGGYLSSRRPLFWFSLVLAGTVVVAGAYVAPQPSPERATILVAPIPKRDARFTAATEQIRQVARNHHCDLVIFVATSTSQLPPPNRPNGPHKPAQPSRTTPTGSTGPGTGGGGRQQHRFTPISLQPANPAAANRRTAAAGTSPASELIVVNGSGAQGVINALPNGIRVFDEKGTEVRAGAFSHPRRWPFIIWAALVLLLGGLAGHRGVELWRKVRPDGPRHPQCGPPRQPPRQPASEPPWPAYPGLTESRHHAEPQLPTAEPGYDTEKAQAASRTAPVDGEPATAGTAIFDRYFPGRSKHRHNPQCPDCGSFRIRRAANPSVEQTDQYACAVCDARWSVPHRGPWPDLVIEPRRNRGY